ncbi:alanine racemase [Marinobacter sp.]|uniref:alanine racemase n=1 Tax=Marinobacter sp. TaxID=50741 RepID=UPI003563CB96
MSRPTIARIHLDNLRHNYRLARRRAAPARTIAVVKADGYGHGIERVAFALSEETDQYAVACLEEAVALREAGLTQPVLLMQGVHEAADLRVCEAERFTVVVHDPHQLEWLETVSGRPDIWLKINSGMNRLGFAPADLEKVRKRLVRAGVRVTGAMTHFACADDEQSQSTARQTRIFDQATGGLGNITRSVANSAAHFRDGQAMFDRTRPGIMLYGGSPMLGRYGPELGLKAAMTLESRLIAIRQLSPGDAVGYGETWRATRSTLMGMVCIGYGDGYPRHAPNGTPVWLRGTRAPLIGRVSMDMLAIDLGDVPGAAVGDTVELWGEHIPVDEVADCAGTISYELLTGVTRRVPRVEAGESMRLNTGSDL